MALTSRQGLKRSCLAMTSGSSRHSSLVETAAAAAFAGACAFAIARLLAFHGLERGAVAASIVTCALMLVIVSALLRRVSAAGRLTLPEFVLEPLPPLDRRPAGMIVPGPHCPAGGELLLDDRLAAPAPGARVVQLFGPEAAPPRSVPPDASEALRKALQELRRSLR